MNDANQDLKFALINAIYFNGKWKYKFDKKNTSKKIFNNYRGEAQQVEMLQQNEAVKYDQNEAWKMISRPNGNTA